MKPQQRTARRQDERGAAMVFTLATFSLTLAIVSFVINVGSDRLVRRDLQASADVVALDLARELNGSAASSYPGFTGTGPSNSLFSSAKSASLGRQGWKDDSNHSSGRFADLNPSNVRVQLWKRDPAQPADVDPRSVNLVPITSSSDIPIAVKVWVAGSSAFRMLPDFWRAGRPTDPDLTDAHIERSGLAVIGRPLVCISAGATLASMTPNGNLDLLLSRLAWGDATSTRLSAFGPSGVFDAKVPLGPLAAELGFGSVDQLLTANLTAREFLLAAADVLTSSGTTSVSALQTIAAAPNLSGTIHLDDILNLNTGAGSAADLTVDTSSLIQAVIMKVEVANGSHFVTVGTTAGITGIATVPIQAKVTQPPEIACGPADGTTVAKSSQVELSLSAELSILTLLLSSAKIDELSVKAAGGSGTITSLTCTTSGATLGVSAQAYAAKAKLGVTVKLIPVPLLGQTVVAIKVPDPATQPTTYYEVGAAGPGTLSFTYPGDWGTKPYGSNSPLNLAGQSVKFDVSGLALGNVLSLVVNPVLAVLDPMLNGIVDGVLTSLGIRLGTVEIRPTTLPACNEPFLRD